MTISQQAVDVRAIQMESIVGALAFNTRLTDNYNALNSDPQAVQISTVTVTGVVGIPLDYTIAINGVDVTYSAVGGDTTTDVAAGLKAAVDAEPAVGNNVVATSALAVMTLTGQIPGESFTVTESDSQMTTATIQAAATAAAVPYGRVVVDTGGSADDPADRLAAIASTTQFTAQSASGVVAGMGAGESVTFSVSYQGSTYSVNELFDTDDDATAGNVRASLAAALPTGLTVGGATDTVIVTADTAGDAFSLAVSDNFVTVTGNASPSAATSLAKAIGGLNQHMYSDAATTVGATSTETAPNRGMLILRGGNSMWVENSDGVSDGDEVYVDLTAGDGAGKMYNATGSGRVWVDPSTLVWERAGRTSSDNIALVRIAA